MDELSSEFGPIKKRIASVRWATWVQFSGREVRGMPSRSGGGSSAAGMVGAGGSPASSPTTTARGRPKSNSFNKGSGGMSLRSASDHANNVQSMARRASAEFRAQDLAELHSIAEDAAEEGAPANAFVEKGIKGELVDTRVHPLHLLDSFAGGGCISAILYRGASGAA